MKYYNAWIWFICLGLLSCGSDEPQIDTEESQITVQDQGFQTEYSCEEHWLTDVVVQDLTRMAGLVEGSGWKEDPVVLEVGLQSYTIKGDEQLSLTLSPNPWATKSYEDLLTALNVSLETASDEVSEGKDLLGSLINPTVTALEEVNLDISKDLKARPFDPQLHEEAAFLLGVFGLQENANMMSDTRLLLCRITAHLAFAKALRGGEEGQGKMRIWADILHQYHCGRKTVAMDSMKNLKPQSEEEKTWIRAIDVFVRGDWRVMVKDEESLSLLESMAHVRALRVNKSLESALEFVRKNEMIQQSADWSRTLSYYPSVGVGHVLLKSSLSMELSEITQFQALESEEDFYKLLPSFLNTKSADSLVDGDELSVIHKGDWAAFFTRHLRFTHKMMIRFTSKTWGSDEAAESLYETMNPLMKKLNGHKLYAVNFCSKQWMVDAAKTDVLKELKKDPRAMTLILWQYHEWSINGFKVGLKMPDHEPWFRQFVPLETAYQAAHRMFYQPQPDKSWKAFLDKSYSFDPWDVDVCRELCEYRKSAIEDSVRALSEIRDFSTPALRRLVIDYKNDAEKRISILRELAEYDSDEWIDVGFELILLGKEKEAAEAYFKALDKGENRVLLANKMLWLVRYLFKEERFEDAKKIADMCADVYSYRGLKTAMLFALAQGEVEQAEEYALNIRERYGYRDEQIFMKWVKAKRSVHRAPSNIFPDGLEKVTVTELESTQAKAGVRLRGASSLMKAYGLRKQDIVLAVDGIRVTSYEQIEFCMNMNFSNQKTLIVLRGRRKTPEYFEMKAIMPFDRFGVKTTDVK